MGVYDAVTGVYPFFTDFDSACEAYLPASLPSCDLSVEALWAVSSGNQKVLYPSLTGLGSAEKMESIAKLGDPLAINLRRQTSVLLAQIPQGSPHAPALKNAFRRTELLNTLSYLLSLPAYTNAVAVAFRPILLDLCARWLHDEENELERFEALCLLLEIHIEIYPYVCDCLLLAPI